METNKAKYALVIGIIALLFAYACRSSRRIPSEVHGFMLNHYTLDCKLDTGFVWVRDSVLLKELYNTGYYKDDLGDKGNRHYVLLEEGMKNISIKNNLILSDSWSDTTCFSINYCPSLNERWYCRFRGNKLLTISTNMAGRTVGWKFTAFDYYGNIQFREFVDTQQDPIRYTDGSGLYKDYNLYTMLDTILCKDQSKREEILYKTIREWTNDSIVMKELFYRSLNDSLIRREETIIYMTEIGEIENNYKVGTWKYYDKEGNLTHTQYYKKRDKVDVRFPYCLFNKKEPCLCD